MGIRYNPALDGLRAIAALVVAFMHCHVPILRGGYLGVDLFFVLSGFLITTILAQEHHATGRIALADFYVRRVRRLYPPLLLMLAAYLLLAPLRWPDHPHGRDALLAALYVSDYSEAFWRMPKYIVHTWSLSAEEHYYLLWPLVLMWLLRTQARETVARWLLIAIFAAWAWREANWLMGVWGYTVSHRFDTKLVGLLAGCWLAIAKPQWDARKAAAWGVVGFVAALAIAKPIAGAVVLGHIPLAELASVGLVYGASALPIGRLAYLGKLSYGIYLWHYPLVRAVPGPWWVEVAVVIPLSILLAALSYHTIEAYFRAGRTQRAGRLAGEAQP